MKGTQTVFFSKITKIVAIDISRRDFQAHVLQNIV